jgi:hypothetical protein
VTDGNQQASALRLPTVWRAFWFERALGVFVTWALLLLGAVGAILNALGNPGSWGEACGAAAVAALAAFAGHAWIVEADVGGEVLHTRRLFPGRAETIPLSRIRSAHHDRIAFSDSISLRFSALAFAAIRYYGLPRSQREPWLALVAGLRQALGDRWHE